MKLISADRIFINNQLEKNKVIFIDNGKITAIKNKKDCDENKIEFFANKILAPAFIDLQLNGCGGVMFNDDISCKTLDIMHKTNLKSGTAFFLPTFITDSFAKMQKALEVVKEYKKLKPNRILGIHLEGPHLDITKKGIHPKEHIKNLDQKHLEFYLKNIEAIKMITLSPNSASNEQIKKLTNAGIIVSLGHTNANDKTIKSAFRSGASFVTHLFNAMSQITPRDGGLVGNFFTSDDVFAGIIADGFHLSWDNFSLSYKLKKDNLCLVTDATAAAGSNIKSFNFVGQNVDVIDRKCINKDGTLGGSALTFDTALKNIKQNTQIKTEDILQMATTNIAIVLKNQNIGIIKDGALAKFNLFDKDLNFVKHLN